MKKVLIFSDHHPFVLSVFFFGDFCSSSQRLEK
jgi:hypothetical protein